MHPGTVKLLYVNLPTILACCVGLAISDWMFKQIGAGNPRAEMARTAGV